MDAAEAAEERALLGLRTVEGVPLANLAPLGLRAGGGALESLIADGFLRIEGERLVATQRGRPVLDGVLKALLT